MSTRINTNTTAFNAAGNLSLNTANESRDIQRLSSGLRINSAADDPSGYVLSQSLQAQSGSLTQATNNTNDAINVVKTAEGALTQVQALLVNIRQTIVQAANVGSNNTTALQADQQAVADSVASIDRIAGTTQFNGKNLLDGAASALGATNVGTASASTNATFSVATQATTYPTSINGAAVAFVAAVADKKDFTNADITAGSVFNGSLTTADGKSVTLPSGGGNLAALNAALTNAGSTYQATITSGHLAFTNSVTGAPSGSFNTSSLTFTSAPVTVAADAPNSTTGTSSVAAVDAVKGTVAEPISASSLFSGSFTSTDGKSITLAAGSTLAQINAALGAASSNNTATIVGGDLKFTSSANGVSAGSYTNLTFTNQETVAANAGGSVAGVNAGITLAGINATSTTVAGNTTTSTFANGLQLSTTAVVSGALGTLTATPDALTPGNALQFQIGANQNQTISVSISSQKSNSIGAYTNTTSNTSFHLSDLLSGGNLNLTDASGKSQQDALAVVDQAIKDISTTSEKLGSIQTNVLQSNINSLSVSEENTNSSLSTVRDTDLAATVVDYTKNQILVQAGTSALSYANQAPQAILKLLQ